MTRPLIGINCNLVAAEHGPQYQLYASYGAAVRRAAGLPVFLPPPADELEAEAYLSRLDGFVFSGGPDLDPAAFGESRHATVEPVHPDKQRGDLALARAFVRRSKPFLAICYGCQLVNVALGGTLIQDIPSYDPRALEHRRSPGGERPRHPVKIEAGAALARVLAATEIEANTSHHQAIARPGENVRVTALAPDGIVEGGEVSGHPFGLLVQWHPEAMPESPTQRRLFDALVAACRR